MLRILKELQTLTFKCPAQSMLCVVVQSEVGECLVRCMATSGEQETHIGINSKHNACLSLAGFSFAEARNRYRLDVRPSVRLSVRHTLALYQNG